MSEAARLSAARGGAIWRVRGAAVVRGTLVAPGDKSIAHRVLLAAALARGASRLRGLPGGDDVERTRAALAALGIRSARRGAALVVHGAGFDGLRAARGTIDCGNSGTTLRLLCGVLAGERFATTLTGDASLRRRPMRRIAVPLRAMGARIECRGEGDRPPVRVGGGVAPLRGATLQLDVDSAQVRGAILFAALRARGPTRLAPRGASRDHLPRLLGALGVRVEESARALVLHPPTGWDGFEYDVPGDLSSAAFWIAFAAATPGSALQVRGVGLNPGRARVLEVLRRAGADLEWKVESEAHGEPRGTVRVRGGARLRAAVLVGDDVVRCIDEIPAIAAAAAIAGAALRVRDAAELRVKESDRIARLVTVLSAFGARCRERRDGFDLAAGARLAPAAVDAGGDHRIAMAAALLALAVPGTSRIAGAGGVRTSYPEFAAHLKRLARDRPVAAGRRRV